MVERVQKLDDEGRQVAVQSGFVEASAFRNELVVGHEGTLIRQ